MLDNKMKTSPYRTNEQRGFVRMRDICTIMLPLDELEDFKHTLANDRYFEVLVDDKTLRVHFNDLKQLYPYLQCCSEDDILSQYVKSWEDSYV